MSVVTAADVRTFVSDFLKKKLEGQRGDVPEELPYDYDLLLSGTIDSIGLLELVTATNEHYGGEIDFDGLDAEQMTVVGPFCRYVSEQIAKS
jgi:acyl carrier protein